MKINKWSDAFFVGGEVTVHTNLTPSTALVSRATTTNSISVPISELNLYTFNIEYIGVCLILSSPEADYNIESFEGLRLEDDMGNMFHVEEYAVKSLENAYDEPKQPCVEQSTTSTEDSTSNTHSEAVGGSTQGLKEKVIPTQRSLGKVTEKSLQEFTEDTIKDVICPIAKEVTKKLAQRANVGYTKYGVTADRTDLSLVEWLTHAQEEAMDLAIYLEKIKKELVGNE